MESMIIEASEKQQVTCKEFVFLLANRLYFSRAYTRFYIVMIALNTVTLIWMLATQGYPGSFFFGLLEIIITLALILEVCMKMITQRKSYFHRWSNWFDVLVVAMSLGAIAIYFEGPSPLEEADEIMSTSLIVLRYFIQGMRLYMLIRHQRMIDHLTGKLELGSDDVDFSKVEDPDVDMFDRNKGDFSADLGLRINLSSKTPVDRVKLMHAEVETLGKTSKPGEIDVIDQPGALIDDTSFMLDRIMSSSRQQSEIQLI